MVKTKKLTAYVFDNEGKTYDRYTIILSDGEVYGANENPFHPLGFGQYSGNVCDRMNTTYGYGWRKHFDEKKILKHELANYLNEARGDSSWLGKEVKDLTTLPEPVQQYIQQLIS